MTFLERKLRVGCSGWSYKDWVGPFYPQSYDPKNFLHFYSTIFNAVEIDSSFYRIPYPSLVTQWRNTTPQDFRFTAKFPKRITHDAKLINITPLLERFYGSLNHLHEKLGPLIVQLPPSIKYDKHHTTLERFLAELDNHHRHAIEFRHPSWFRQDVYTLLEKHHVALCWSVNQYLTTPDTITTDFTYLRMVGDRALTKFDATQRDQSAQMKEWAEKIQANADGVDEAFVFFNNHFTGFGPESVNEFRRLVGLMEMNWTQVAGTEGEQKSLLEF